MSAEWMRFEDPRCPLVLVAQHEFLTEIRFGGQIPAQENSARHPVLVEAAKQLREYFDGSRKQFALPLRPAGTEFQRNVWAALLTVPYGETRSYSEIARQVGSPAAVRAIGAANGRNPIPIVIPCHRVIGASGKLTGFGGGLPLKKLLLDLERPPNLFT